MITFFIISLISLAAVSCTSPVNQLNDKANFIYRGQNAIEGQFPHQVSILHSSSPKKIGTHSCGGSIIHKNWVLTAANCVVDDLEVAKYNVAAGNLEHSKGTIYKVDKIIIHEKYMRYMYDIALLKIAGDGFDFSNPYKIALITLLQEEVPRAGKISISGWGRNKKCITSSHLQFINEIENGDAKECSGMLSFPDDFYNSILCLKHKSKIIPCDTYNGGPAHYENKLAGVANVFVNEGCVPDKPDTYAKVSYFVPWINRNIYENI